MIIIAMVQFKFLDYNSNMNMYSSMIYLLSSEKQVLIFVN